MCNRGFCRNDLTNLYGFINHGTLRINTKRADRGLKTDIMNESPCHGYIVVYICNENDGKPFRLNVNEIFLIDKNNKKLLTKNSCLEEFLDEYGVKVWTLESGFLISMGGKISKNIIYGDIIELFDDDILDTEGYLVSSLHKKNEIPSIIEKNIISEIDIVWGYLRSENYVYTFKNNKIMNRYKLTRYRYNNLWKIEKTCLNE